MVTAATTYVPSERETMSDQKNGSRPNASQVEVSKQMPQWDRFLAQHAGTTIYHSPRWGEVMRRAYGNRPFYLTAYCDGQITGILQLVAQKSVIFGYHLCSLPYFDASGILALDDRAAAALVDKARDLVKEQCAEWIELRHLRQVCESLPVRSDKVTMSLRLPENEDELWLQFKPKVRNQIRKAQQADLQVDQGGPELINEFYAVYCRNMRDLGSPPHSRRFFRLVSKSFPVESRLHVVRLEGKAIAGSFTLAEPKVLRVPWAGSDWRSRGLNANMLLYWSMLAEGCRIRAECFDFGRSSVDSGTYRFKKQWGAKEVPLFWQFLPAEGKGLPNMNPDSAKYRRMVACWKKLPVWAARWIGPRIIGRLS